jgi:hypothetical protein
VQSSATGLTFGPCVERQTLKLKPTFTLEILKLKPTFTLEISNTWSKFARDDSGLTVHCFVQSIMVGLMCEPCIKS